MTREQQKRILIAGGSGFLGANLARMLLKEGHTVICLDNFSSGKRSNLAGIASPDRLQIIDHDVADPLSLSVDQIFNMACVASPVQYQEDPLQTLRTSTVGTANLLQLAIANNARMFQASTSEVYGNPHVHPQNEDYFGNVNPIGPRACYDEGKRCAETLCMDYHRMHGAKVKIARIFNTYGPYMHPQDGRVVSNFIVQALQNKPITVYGDGSQTRSFCYADDLLEGILTLMRAPLSIMGPINIGNPDEFTVLELATQVIEMTGSRSKIVFEPLPQDDPVKRRPDITRAKTLLDWTPKVKLSEGLVRTIEYFEAVLREEKIESAVSETVRPVGRQVSKSEGVSI